MGDSSYFYSCGLPAWDGRSGRWAQYSQTGLAQGSSSQISQTGQNRASYRRDIHAFPPQWGQTLPWHSPPASSSLGIANDNPLLSK